MRLFLRRLALVVISLSVWGISSSSLANTETVVTNIHDGHNPYMVVVKDDGPSKLPPGIYYSNLLGKWELFIPGDVLKGGSNQGILSRLSLTTLDKRYGALAVVDQKIKLFQMNADHMSDKSIITLGEGSAELSDIHGTPVTLPPVTNLKDIIIKVLDPGTAGQAILISVRTPINIMGDGITFAFFVKTGDPKFPDQIQLIREPIVVDYKFLDLLTIALLMYSANYIAPHSKTRIIRASGALSARAESKKR